MSAKVLEAPWEPPVYNRLEQSPLTARPEGLRSTSQQLGSFEQQAAVVQDVVGELVKSIVCLVRLMQEEKAALDAERHALACLHKAACSSSAAAPAPEDWDMSSSAESDGALSVPTSQEGCSDRSPSRDAEVASTPQGVEPTSLGKRRKNRLPIKPPYNQAIARPSEQRSSVPSSTSSGAPQAAVPTRRGKKIGWSDAKSVHTSASVRTLSCETFDELVRRTRHPEDSQLQAQVKSMSALPPLIQQEGREEDMHRGHWPRGGRMASARLGEIRGSLELMMRAGGFVAPSRDSFESSLESLNQSKRSVAGPLAAWSESPSLEQLATVATTG
eukprot:TRINITY_DN10374_c0_g1_i5.p1 TRINITY_DN10374_c0_g1~~TRINITY_DN10374_c0_g1_i5.p1  ORF type:complete len:330 (-),score=64.09 TRINITY_DN10374_c0_g1_i5:392-1381(-)